MIDATQANDGTFTSADVEKVLRARLTNTNSHTQFVQVLYPDGSLQPPVSEAVKMSREEDAPKPFPQLPLGTDG